MKTYPPGSPQALSLNLQRVMETIAQINSCLPTQSGVQAATAGLLNACTTWDTAVAVLSLQLQAAICWLGSGGVGDCIRPDPACDFYTVKVVTPDNPDGTFGTLNIYDAWAKGLVFADLTHCFGDMIFTQKGSQDPDGMPFCSMISAPLLTAVDGTIFTAFSHALLTIAFPLLTTVGVDCVVGSSNNATSIDIHSLQHVGQDLSLGGSLNPTIDLSSLLYVGRDALLGATTIISAPLLAHIGRDIELGQNGPTTTVDLSGLTSFNGNFTGTNAAFSEDTVNNLLIKFAALGVGPGKILRFDGGTSAAPTGAGATAKATLIGLGNTVMTN